MLPTFPLCYIPCHGPSQSPGCQPPTFSSSPPMSQDPLVSTAPALVNKCCHTPVSLQEPPGKSISAQASSHLLSSLKPELRSLQLKSVNSL